MVRGQEEWLKEAMRIKEQEEVREPRRRQREYQEELEREVNVVKARDQKQMEGKMK